MYYSFYGLSRPPFNVTPDPSFMYMSAQHREALAAVAYGVSAKKGFIVLTGEVGLGKTTVLRAYFDQANSKELKLIHIFTPIMTRRELIHFIAGELGVSSQLEDLALLNALQLKLLDLYTQNKTVGLIIDEAQTLSPSTIEFLRLLGNLETNTDKLLQIILVGQPELEELLLRKEMRQVNQRVTIRCHLKPFSVKESIAYITHRLRETGCGRLEDVMTRGAARLIAVAAGGVPRVINVLSDNVLLAGYGADKKPVGSKLAWRVVSDFSEAAGVKPSAALRFRCWLG